VDSLISIIIPVYNAEKYIKECIDSVIHQTYKNIEIIIVNDNSLDKSWDICKEYSKIDRRIKLIKNDKNQGVSRTRNIGIKNSKGKYIIFLDSDDCLELNMIETLYKNLVENYSDISVCNFKTYEDKLFTQKVVQLNREEVYKKLLDLNSFGGYPWNKLFKREILDKMNNNFFDEELYSYEDLYFLSNYVKYINKCTYIDQGLYKYNIRNNSLSHSTINIKKVENCILAYRKIISVYKEEKIDDMLKVLNEDYLNYLLEYKSFLKQDKLNELVVKNNKEIKEVYKSIKKMLNLKKRIKYIIKIYFYNVYYFIWIKFNIKMSTSK